MINHISEIELKDCNSSMDIWDGNSAMRIKDVLVNEIV